MTSTSPGRGSTPSCSTRTRTRRLVRRPPTTRSDRRMTSPLAAVAPVVDGETTRRRGWGWLLLVPGMLYLAVFFVFPTIQLFFTSLYDPTGSFEQGYEM